MKETAKLEAEAFELEQKTALAAEAKAALDSWVRYEGQVKQRQQKELAETVIAKVSKELENPKILQQVLQQSVADIESKQSPKLWLSLSLTFMVRGASIKGIIDDFGSGLDRLYIKPWRWKFQTCNLPTIF